MQINDTARSFFEACETGRGWAGCREYCHEDATFSCQADALSDLTTVADYVEWTKGLLIPIPDGHYQLKSWAVDEARNSVMAAAVFIGTQTGEGGPVAPTGKSVATDYVYVMDFDDGKIRHMTKIWNDIHSLKQLGWA